MATNVNLGILGAGQKSTPSSKTGGASPYQQIMAQMPAFVNPYANSSGGPLGGYNPNLYNNPPVGNTGQSGSGGGGGGSDAYSDPNSAWSNMTDAEKAAYYAENPTMASITQALQNGFSFTTPGMLQNYFNPGFVSEQGLIAMGVDPAAYQAAKESFRASEIADMNAGYTGGDSGGYNASDYGGYSGSETQSSGESYANYKGGLVSNVFGSDPAGPDDGAGYLQRGEYVIKKSAVKKYGQGLLDMINDGKIPAKKMKSLLG